jgi:hypothetical protein
MLNEIHSVLQRLIYDFGRINPDDVDVRFDTPIPEWVNSLTRPTIDFFMFDVQENTDMRDTNLQVVRQNGKAERRMPPRRIDLYYMVAAFTSEAVDEHQLLWRLLTTLMKHDIFPQEVLPESLKSLDPTLTTRLAKGDDKPNLVDIWSAFGGPPHPALCYVITVPLDLNVAIDLPVVLTRTARYRRIGDSPSDDYVGIQIGGFVRDKDGNPLPQMLVTINDSGKGTTTNAAGRFVLREVPIGSVTLNVLENHNLQKRVEINVPSESYDIVLDR